jgi:hypothetical protein
LVGLFSKADNMIGLFKEKLTNKSIAALEEFKNAIETSVQVQDVFAALHQADLLKYHTKEGMKERFGSRCSKEDFLSYMFGVINGMANKIEEQQAIIIKMREDAGKPQ